MTFVQAMTGSGGWPLKCIYFPGPETVLREDLLAARRKQGTSRLSTSVCSRSPRPGANVEINSPVPPSNCIQRLLEITQRSVTNSILLTNAVLRNAGRELKTATIRSMAGWCAPKFPSPAIRHFSCGSASVLNDQEAVNMVLHTLDRMAAGGIYDQIGGGFSRYSTDEKWLVPHFEKMLTTTPNCSDFISTLTSSAASRNTRTWLATSSATCSAT